jgi:hypothetical protein
MADFLPRILATLLLLVSLAMLIPLGFAVAELLRGEPVASSTWLFPLTILATGSALIYLLARKAVSLQMFVAALALWLLVAGYYLFTSIRAF